MITLSDAEPGDTPAIAELGAEMMTFYGAARTDPPEVLIRQVNDALFGEAAQARAVLAWRDEKLVGFAVYYFMWPAAGLTRSLYLKELFISASARRSGAGTLLMDRMCELAVIHGCSRVEWTADTDNLAAQRFYQEFGASPHMSKILYRIPVDDLPLLRG